MSYLTNRKLSPQKIALAIAAPLAAAVVSIVVSSLAVVASNKSPMLAYKTMWEFGTQGGSLMEMLNQATPYYIAAIAIAVTFRAGLFNIGVEGQLRLGALFSAYIGAMFTLPPVLHVLAVFIVAMTIGGLWASIAAYLKVKRGVNEVISTIMLNSLAVGVTSFLFSKYFAVITEGSNNLSTKELPKSAWFPDLVPLLTKMGVPEQPGGSVNGMLVIADQNGAAQIIENSLCKLADGFLRIKIMREDCKFITAEARYGVFFTQPANQTSGDFFEQFITGVMAKRIVDALKLIQIKIQQSKVVITPGGHGNSFA